MSDKVVVKTKAELEDDTPISIPIVSSKKAGRVGQIMEGLALAYKKENPGKGARWVYSPLHRSELSNVITRRAQGYRPILAKDIGNLDGFDPDDQVRVGDCILMGVDEAVQTALRKESQNAADDQMQSVEREHYETVVEKMASTTGRKHRTRPSGRAVIEERDYEFEIKQRED